MKRVLVFLLCLELSAASAFATGAQKDSDVISPEKRINGCFWNDIYLGSSETKELSDVAPTNSVRPKVRQLYSVEQPADVIEFDRDIYEQHITIIPKECKKPSGSTSSNSQLSSSDKNAFGTSVQQCWNVDSLSTDALQTIVVVAFELNEDAKPVANSIRMISSSGGSSGSARQAYDAARRAIIRCGARGYDLPAGKYDQWCEVELTFNPENMRIK